MEQKKIEELLTKEFKIVQGSGSKIISNISTDSRSISYNEMFVALKGEYFDGHNFIEDAVKKGAAALLVSNQYEVPEWLARHEDITVVKIFDTLYGLGELARVYRAGFQIPAVGITGSNGKTSTKDMLAAILSQKEPITKTIGNLNNLVGVPLTLFRISYETGFIVAEMGMSQLGEIKRLTEILNPDVGIVTNIGESHLEFLGDVLTVARGKKEMIEMMAEKDTIIVNADDVFLDTLILGFKGKVITFGINSEANFRGENIKLSKESTEFTVNGLRINLKIAGYHFVYNALSAIAAAKHFGITDNQIKEALDNIKLSPMRMELIAAKQYLIINDSYNANPRSMRAALRTFYDIPLEGRRVLILGDMLELGPQCIDLHIELGKEIDKEKIDLLITYGGLASFIIEGAIESGFDKSKIRAFKDKEECINYLKNVLKEGDNILVKGSRGMKMEEIIDGIAGSGGREM
ncbi:MAG: UDP-N-acetylmuramoyl-tripeptide--D-alanyl-D-alanine ligase [Candidatus Hydrogenedentota bacterium]